MRSILLFKKLLGLVEMTSGLVNVSFSLPEWQAVKMIFFAPCYVYENKIKPSGNKVLPFSLACLMIFNNYVIASF